MPWRHRAVGGLLESGELIMCGGYDAGDDFRGCLIVGNNIFAEIPCVYNRLYTAGLVFGQTFLLTGGITRYSGCSKELCFLNDPFTRPIFGLGLSIPLNWFTQMGQNQPHERTCPMMFARIAWSKSMTLRHFLLAGQKAKCMTPP